jgi:L-ascorbate metabolism protein UlaG (beta-lactamase superfamily)
MRITWYGHASFGIETETGLCIITDPYDPDRSGYRPFPKHADVIIKSSSTDDGHNNDHLVPQRDGSEVIDALGLALSGETISSHGVTFRAIEAMEHEKHRDHNPDQNAMYRFSVDGVEIVHMGDIGNRLSNTQIDFLRGADILLALAGGFPGIELHELKNAIDKTRPRIVIPMHFRTLRYRFKNMHWIPEFLSYFPNEKVDFAFSCDAKISKKDLPSETRVLILDYF